MSDSPHSTLLPIDTPLPMPRVVGRRIPFRTNWFAIEEKYLDGEKLPYYSLHTLDYVSVLALSTSGNVILVRQYRPAVEGLTLELPSGHVEKDETPECAARRELLEETGYQAQEMQLLGRLIPDTGRLGNKLWCFFAPGAVQVASGTEPAIQVVECSAAELNRLVLAGAFTHALHLAILALATSRKHWQTDC